MIKILLIILLIALLAKLLILRSKHEELFNYWANSNFDINKMYSLSTDEKKVLNLLKRLGILFFIGCFILFLIFAPSTLKG